MSSSILQRLQQSYFVVNLACCIIYTIWITKFVGSVLDVTNGQKLFYFVRQISAINVQLSILIILAITVDKFVLINWGRLYETWIAYPADKS